MSVIEESPDDNEKTEPWSDPATAKPAAVKPVVPPAERPAVTPPPPPAADAPVSRVEKAPPPPPVVTPEVAKPVAVTPPPPPVEKPVAAKPAAERPAPAVKPAAAVDSADKPAPVAEKPAAGAKPVAAKPAAGAATKPAAGAGATGGAKPAAVAKPAAAPAAPTKWELPRWWEDWPKLTLRQKLLGLIRACGVAVLVAVPTFLLLYHPQPDHQKLDPSQPWLHVQWPAGRYIWTVIVAILPFFIVLMGFYNWRSICPLAFFGRMSEWIGWPDPKGALKSKRKFVPNWLVTNYPYVTWGFLAAMMTLRILLINSNPVALAWAFIGLMILAALISFRFAGKSWCQYFCPVSTIQRIYTDTDNPNWRNNSQCTSCTKCKVIPSGGRCPDIDTDKDYWQEVKNPARAWAFFAWPGTVLGFYTWYFLHKPYYGHELFASLLNQGITQIRNFNVIEEAHHFGVELTQNAAGHWFGGSMQGTTGTDWYYYMSGDWTRNPEPWKEWMGPGWGFHGAGAALGVVPMILAAPITMMLFSTASFLLFKGIELIWMQILTSRGVDRDSALEGVRHAMFSICGFTAFMLFYTFAGAPTFRQFPLQLYSLFYIVVTVLATYVLFTRLRQTRAKYQNAYQARQWLNKWPIPGQTTPQTAAPLDEVYNLVTLELKFKDGRVQTFKDSVRNMLADALISAEELNLLDRMANDLNLSDKEKKGVYAELSKDSPELFQQMTGGVSADKLRLVGYRGELERAISQNKGMLPAGDELARMQEQYRISPDEHDEVLRDLLNPNGQRAQRLREEATALGRTRALERVLASGDTAATEFLTQELRRRIRADRDHILAVSNLYGPADELNGLRARIRDDIGVGGADGTGAVQALLTAGEWLTRHLPAELVSEIQAAVGEPLMTSSVEVNQNARARDTALATALTDLTGDAEPLVRAAAVFDLRRFLFADDQSMSMSSVSYREEAAGRAAVALQDRDVLVRTAAIHALAPDWLTPPQWEMLLSTRSETEIRRTAAIHLPRPLPAPLRMLVDRLMTSETDEIVRAAAVAARSGTEARLPNGRPIPILSRLERLLVLREGRGLLASLPTDALSDLAGQAEEIVFQPGELLCEEGGLDDTVFLLISGTTEAVRQMKEGALPVRVGTNNPGEVVGEMAALDPAPRSATVRALEEPVRTLAVRGEVFRNLLGQDAAASLDLVRLIIRRMRTAAAPAAAAPAPVAGSVVSPGRS